VVVDSTAPDVAVKSNTVDDQQLTLEFVVEDATSPIEEVAYTVDGETPYQPVLPDDLIFDSTREACSFTIDDLSTGSHVITIRALDERGNPVYHTATVEVE
jgi:hypothetical protein